MCYLQVTDRVQECVARSYDACTGLQACAESCLRDTLCALTPSHTLPTAALLGAVLAMETECHWDRR